MSEVPPERPFARQILIENDLLVGARWWQESLRLRVDPVSRRRALKALALVLGGSAAAFGLVAALSSPGEDADVSMDALDLQKREGWNVGQPRGGLRFPSSTALDADGSRSWVDGLPALAGEMAPAQPSLAPFYVPTLFQALGAASSASLRSALTPIPPAAGNKDVLRGEAILSLFKAVQMPTDTAVILDVEGPSSVAVAAGMAPGFEPVFTFDNWPHPLGVVPSHLTLGAVLYHRPMFLRARGERAIPAPPVFVLDRNRLAHYTDEDTQFDNRYVAKLPTPQNLHALGVRHVLYVSPSKSDMRELDDLNDDLVAFASASIDVKIMPLTDLDPPPTGSSASTMGPSAARYYYGGHPHTHLWFWSSYGWHTPGIVTQRQSSAPVAPPSVSRGAEYRPALRPTIFSSRTTGGGPGIGKQKPSGFGRVSVRTSKSTGTITGIRSGRSGSFGRAGSGSGG
jgi:hypothetical protein